MVHVVHIAYYSLSYMLRRYEETKGTATGLLGTFSEGERRNFPNIGSVGRMVKGLCGLQKRMRVKGSGPSIQQ